jgi:hypothetical protein
VIVCSVCCHESTTNMKLVLSLAFLGLVSNRLFLVLVSETIPDLRVVARLPSAGQLIPR